jgi:hypothetical protein
VNQIGPFEAGGRNERIGSLATKIQPPLLFEVCSNDFSACLIKGQSSIPIASVMRNKVSKVGLLNSRSTRLIMV